MSPSDRAPFQTRALFEKNNGTGAQRYTSEGYAIEDIELQIERQALREKKLKETVKNIIKTAQRADSNKNKICRFNDISKKFLSELGEEVFLLIHINHLVHHPQDDRYYICEVAIVAFNLKQGILDIYTNIVQPGIKFRNFVKFLV